MTRTFEEINSEYWDARQYVRYCKARLKNDHEIWIEGYHVRKLKIGGEFESGEQADYIMDDNGILREIEFRTLTEWTGMYDEHNVKIFEKDFVVFGQHRNLPNHEVFPYIILHSNRKCGFVLSRMFFSGENFPLTDHDIYSTKYNLYKENNSIGSKWHLCDAEIIGSMLRCGGRPESIYGKYLDKIIKDREKKEIDEIITKQEGEKKKT